CLPPHAQLEGKKGEASLVCEMPRQPAAAVRLHHGTTAKNKKTAKITKCTTPCSTVVRPVPNVITPTKSVKAKRSWSLLPSPSSRGCCSAIETTATAGIVRPILASADPSARFKLVCSRLDRDARTAARPSGRSTSAAIKIPTTAFG